MTPDQEAINHEIQQAVKIGIIETDVKNLTSKVDTLGQQLREHMRTYENRREG